MRKNELTAYQKADIVVGISEADCKEIIAMDPSLQGKVFFVSFVQSPWDSSSERVDPSVVNPWIQRKNLAFVGNGENPTNVHAINWFIQEVAPELAKGIHGVHTFIIGYTYMRTHMHTLIHIYLYARSYIHSYILVPLSQAQDGTNSNKIVKIKTY